MTKYTTRSQKQQSDKQKYLFQLKHSKRKSKITVDFTPTKALAPNFDESAPTLTTYSILPTFNKDGKHYSLAFFNPYEGLDEDFRMKKCHQKRVKQLSTMIHEDSIMKPKPKRKSYCWVCQCSFDDYLEHIQSDDHSIGIKFSRFNNNILELIDQYGIPPTEISKDDSLETY